MARRQDPSGAALAGSQLQTQLYVNHRTDELEDAIRSAFADLTAAAFEWRSPLASDAYREYWDHPFLERMYLARYSEDLKEFWPSGGPHWDALALVHLPGETQPGALLAEGKSYVAELYGSGTGAKAGSASRKRIEEALAWTQRQLEVTDRDPEAWCGRLYQSANRLAHVCWLRSLGVHAWLVHLLFTDDPIHATTAAEWERAVADVDRELGLTTTAAAGHVILPALDEFGQPSR